MIWYVIGGIGMFIIIMIAVSNNDKDKRNKVLKDLGLENHNFLKTEKYIHGHPDLDTAIDNTEIVIKDDNIIIFDTPVIIPTKVASIKIEHIDNIKIEDDSTIQKRVSIARLLTIGVFAFAFKKSKKEDLAYLIIEWTKGKFSHETIFEFTKENAMQKANEVRNALVRYIDN